MGKRARQSALYCTWQTPRVLNPAYGPNGMHKGGDNLRLLRDAREYFASISLLAAGFGGHCSAKHISGRAQKTACNVADSRESAQASRYCTALATQVAHRLVKSQSAIVPDATATRSSKPRRGRPELLPGSATLSLRHRRCRGDLRRPSRTCRRNNQQAITALVYSSSRRGT